MGKYPLSIVFFVLSVFLGYQLHAEPVWNSYLENDRIHNIALDGDLIWCATNNGIIAFNRVTGDTLRYTTENGLLNTRIYNVVVDHDNAVWCGSSQGLGKFDGYEWTAYPSTEMLGDDQYDIPYGILEMFIDANNNLLFMSNIGTLMFDGDTFHSLPNMEPGDINAPLFTAAPNGDIWIYDYHWNSINCISIVDYSRTLYDIPILDYPIFYGINEGIFYDSCDNLWIGGNEGVFQISLEENSPDDWDQWVLHENYLSSVSAITEDKFGNVWFADGGGLIKYHNGDWERFDYEYMWPPRMIVSDEIGRIWFCSRKGLFSFTPDYVTAVFDTAPAPLALDPPHPNPFNPQTTLSFTLPEAGFARLAVYNLGGQLVRELAAEDLPAGRHEIVWDGRDANGAAVASGVYIARLATGGRSAVRKVTLVR